MAALSTRRHDLESRQPDWIRNTARVDPIPTGTYGALGLGITQRLCCHTAAPLPKGTFDVPEGYKKKG